MTYEKTAEGNLKQVRIYKGSETVLGVNDSIFDANGKLKLPQKVEVPVKARFVVKLFLDGTEVVSDKAQGTVTEVVNKVWNRTKPAREPTGWSAEIWNYKNEQKITEVEDIGTIISVVPEPTPRYVQKWSVESTDGTKKLHSSPKQQRFIRMQLPSMDFQTETVQTHPRSKGNARTGRVMQTISLKCPNCKHREQMFSFFFTEGNKCLECGEKMERVRKCSCCGTENRNLFHHNELDIDFIHNGIPYFLCQICKERKTERKYFQEASKKVDGGVSWF